MSRVIGIILSVWYCPNCRFMNEDHERYCGKCGFDSGIQADG